MGSSIYFRRKKARKKKLVKNVSPYRTGYVNVVDLLHDLVKLNLNIENELEKIKAGK